MMAKLYKKTPKGLAYWEAWDHEETIYVHTGLVGSKGKTTKIRISKGEKALTIMRKLARPFRANGYRPIAEARMETLQVQYPVRGMGTKKDLAFRHETEEFLNNEIGWLGAGHLDGGDIGMGTMNIFLLTVDAEAAVPGVIRALKRTNRLKNAIIGVSGWDPDEPRRVVWPKDFDGEMPM